MLIEQEFVPRVAPWHWNRLPTDARTFEGDAVSREDHLLGDGFGPGVVVDVLEHTTEPALQHRADGYEEETTASW